MHFIRFAWNYLCERQPLLVRSLHLVILCLVLCQIMVSNFMGFGPHGQVSQIPLIHLGTWTHIVTGPSLFPIALGFILIELNRHGLKYFFPYLYGEFSRIKSDLRLLMRLDLPEPAPYGLAVVVQGLGMGALSLVILSGLIWFLSWRYTAPWAHGIRELHQSLTGLIEAYIIGHGAMGVVHIFFQWRKSKAT
jgi:hypothetical protein